jgi:hypothetical protein
MATARDRKVLRHQLIAVSSNCDKPLESDPLAAARFERRERFAAGESS